MSLLFFDIETVPDLARVKDTEFCRVKPPDPLAHCTAILDPTTLGSRTLADIRKLMEQMTPPKEWLSVAFETEQAGKQRKGVLDLCKEQTDEDSSWIKTCSLSPELCKIVSFGWAIDDHPAEAISDSEFGDNERDNLVQFWELVKGRTPVGYNCLGFDLPVIFARSILLDVRPTRKIDTGRFSRDVIDLFIKRFGGYPGTNPSAMKVIAKLYGIDVPAGDVDGSAVFKLWQDGDFDAICRYQVSDVEVTRQLYHKFQGFFV